MMMMAEEEVRQIKEGGGWRKDGGKEPSRLETCAFSSGFFRSPSASRWLIIGSFFFHSFLSSLLYSFSFNFVFIFFFLFKGQNIALG
jgi:hypothetical protein